MIEKVDMTSGRIFFVIDSRNKPFSVRAFVGNGNLTIRMIKNGHFQFEGFTVFHCYSPFLLPWKAPAPRQAS